MSASLRLSMDYSRSCGSAFLERHDLVLAKIVRNNDRDRADVAAIAGGPGLDIDVLRDRYLQELRPKLGRPEREDLTLELWIEIIEETRQRRQR